MHLLIYIDIALFIFVAFFIGYDLFFTLTSFFQRRHKKPRSERFQKFAIVFAAYKEDQVILESVEHILRQDYPKDKYRVIVVSDHMRRDTNEALAKYPIELLTPDFEHSMKHKSITYALDYIDKGIDKVVIMDADNLTDPDFLTRVNDITQGNIALQTHRTLKNDNTSVAVWDGISEEINNTIFRKGRVNIGISSSLIGSGMVFDFEWLKSHMSKCGTFAEDKELDWCVQIRRAGLEIWYEATSTVYHKESMSVGKQSPLQVYYHARNRLLFAKRSIDKRDERIYSYIYQTLVAFPKRLLIYLVKGKFRLIGALGKGLINGLIAINKDINYGKELSSH